MYLSTEALEFWVCHDSLDVEPISFGDLFFNGYWKLRVGKLRAAKNKRVEHSVRRFQWNVIKDVDNAEPIRPTHLYMNSDPHVRWSNLDSVV